MQQSTRAPAMGRAFQNNKQGVGACAQGNRGKRSTMIIFLLGKVDKGIDYC